jgi:hypothetical protein
MGEAIGISLQRLSPLAMAYIAVWTYFASGDCQFNGRPS